MARAWYKRPSFYKGSLRNVASLTPIGFAINAATGGSDITDAAGVTGSGGLASQLSGRPQARAARDAARKQEDAEREKLDLIREMYQQGRQDQMPWLESGRQNLTTLNQLMNQGYFDPTDAELAGLQDQSAALAGMDVEGPAFDASGYQVKDFAFDPASVQLDPGYQFRQDEGKKAIERSAAARGGAMSGGTLKDLMAYGQNLASQEYGNAYNRQYGQAKDIYGIGRENVLDRRAFDYGMYGDDYTKRQNRYGRGVDAYGRSVQDMGRKYGARTDRFNRLSGMAGTGQQTASSLANLGQNYGQTYGEGLSNIGGYRAGSLISGANAKAQGTQNMIDLLMGLGNMGAKALGGMPTPTAKG